ncbi:hypothetical protein [Moraxella oblonga]|uniref:hypothetical protein n=1 Tax=Moraxella oblonga TaxID=200413 RepID=UPI00082B0C6B|nr:hypothetical protein [Moraxella oblonga]
MVFFNELIFWINWAMAGVTTLGIWYCWFVILKLLLLSGLNYGVADLPIQDNLVEFLAFIGWIDIDDDNNPYVPRMKVGFLKSDIVNHCILLFIILFVLMLCYKNISSYGIVIPKELSVHHSSSFDFTFKLVLYTFLFLVKLSLLSIFICNFVFAFKNDHSKNIAIFSLFILIFSTTSLLFGSGAVWGIGYLIDVFRYK